MRGDYDFSQGERGKFCHDATFHLPIYLDPDVEISLRKLAEEKNLDVQTFVNKWLKANLEPKPLTSTSEDD